ncbi:hypothetical protein [Gluconobacter oxydans]|uniref:hypothetical protein n=1 Tax=Gluconobacter oxydans TaxID=442 RepID=UPI003464DB83
MRRITRAVLMAAPLLIGSAIVPNVLVPQAQAHWHGGGRGPGPGYGGPRGGWHGGYRDHSGAIVGVILGGLALGAVGGALLAQPYAAPPPPPPQVVYAPPAVVYAPQPQVVYGPPLVYGPPPGPAYLGMYRGY